MSITESNYYVRELMFINYSWNIARSYGISSHPFLVYFPCAWLNQVLWFKFFPLSGISRTDFCVDTSDLTLSYFQKELKNVMSFFSLLSCHLFVVLTMPTVALHRSVRNSGTMCALREQCWENWICSWKFFQSLLALHWSIPDWTVLFRLELHGTLVFISQPYRSPAEV